MLVPGKRIGVCRPLIISDHDCHATRWWAGSMLSRQAAVVSPTPGASGVGFRRPAHSDHDRILLGLPMMVDPWPPKRVVTLVLQDERANRQVDAETAAHQQQQRSALLVGNPLLAILTCRVDAPLDLDVPGGPDAVSFTEEVANQPPPVLLPIGVGISDMPVLGHHASTSISGIATRDAVSNSARRRSPSMKANRPSLLHRGSSIKSCRPAASRLEYSLTRRISQFASIWPPNRAHHSSSLMTIRHGNS